MTKKIKEKIEKEEKQYNLLLQETNYTVSIIETSELYGEDGEINESDPYYLQPMYEAYIEDKNGDIIDDTTTGRYCDINSVIDEINSTVIELIKKSSNDKEFILDNDTKVIWEKDLPTYIDCSSCGNTFIQEDNKTTQCHKCNAEEKVSDLEDQIDTLAYENKMFAEFLNKLNYTDEQITEIACSGTNSNVLLTKIIRLKWYCGANKENTFEDFKVSLNATTEMIQQCINVALRVRQDETEVFKQMMNKKGFYCEYSRNDIEVFDFN